MKKIGVLLVLNITLLLFAACSAAPVELQIPEREIKVMVGETANIPYALSPAGNAQLKVDFSVDDPAIALVDSAGKIAGLTPGKTSITITAECGDDQKQEQIAVTCWRYMDTLKDIPELLQVDVGEAIDLADINNDYVEWNALSHSDDPAIASCDGSVIKALAPGETSITFTMGTMTHTAKVKAVEMVTDYELDHEAIEGAAGSSATLAVGNCQPENANGGLELTFSSSDESIATVDGNGTVHFITPGEATITAVNELGMETTCSVTVTAKPASQPASGGGMFLTVGNNGGVNIVDETGNVVDTWGQTPAPSESGSSSSSSYDTDNPAVQAVMDMVGETYKCSEVAEAAAQAQGATGWVTNGNTNILAPEGFLGIGTDVSANKIQPGDILYYADGGWGFSHVAVYIGNGMAVHGNFTSSGETKIASAFYTTPTHIIHIG